LQRFAIGFLGIVNIRQTVVYAPRTVSRYARCTRQLSNEPQTIVTREYRPKNAKGSQVLQPGEIGIFYMGSYYGLVKNDGSVEFVSKKS
jgi:hypothetical protein